MWGGKPFAASPSRYLSVSSAPNSNISFHNPTHLPTSLSTSCRVSTQGTLGLGDFGDAGLLLDDRWGLGNVLAEDVALEEVRQEDLGLVADELTCGDGEDLCG